jgi:hypothetical protein
MDADKLPPTVMVSSATHGHTSIVVNWLGWGTGGICIAAKAALPWATTGWHGGHYCANPIASVHQANRNRSEETNWYLIVSGSG